MATKQKTSKSAETGKKEYPDIMEAYKTYLLIHGKPPKSVFEFCKSINLEEPEFYKQFSSFNALEKSIWAGFIQTTIDTLKASAEYPDYPVREKLLSFYYTYVEVLKANRSFILMMCEKSFDLLRKYTLEKSHHLFIDYADELIKEGIETGEIQKRMYISDKYGEGLWVQLLFVLSFWIKDESAGFEKTDAAIEKAVKLSFDLIGPGAVDSLFDMAKFIFQQK